MKYIISIFIFFIFSCSFQNKLLEEYAILNFHKSDIWSLDFSPNSKYLLSGSADSKIVIWDIDLKKQVKVFEEFYKAVYSVKYSNSGNFIAASSYDGLVKIINLNENKVDTYKEHLLSVNNIDIHKSDKFIVSSGSDDKIKVWGTRNLKTFFDFNANNNIKIKAKSIKFSPDGYKVFYSNTDGTIKIFDMNEDKIDKVLDLKSGIINSIDFSPDGKEFACAFSDKKIRIYDTKTLELKKDFIAHNWSVIQVKYSNNGKYIASISHDMKLNLWDRNGNLISSVSPNLKMLNTVAFSPNSKFIAVGGKKNYIKVYKINEI